MHYLGVLDTKPLRMERSSDGMKSLVDREPYQRIRNAPLRFRVSIGLENVRFNARAYIYVMYLDGKPVLHILDSETYFFAARFLPKRSIDAIKGSIVLCWSRVYAELPDKFIVDERSEFPKIIAELAAIHDINIEKGDVEAHYSLGIG